MRQDVDRRERPQHSGHSRTPHAKGRMHQEQEEWTGNRKWVGWEDRWKRGTAYVEVRLIERRSFNELRLIRVLSFRGALRRRASSTTTTHHHHHRHHRPHLPSKIKQDCPGWVQSARCLTIERPCLLESSGLAPQCYVEVDRETHVGHRTVLYTHTKQGTTVTTVTGSRDGATAGPDRCQYSGTSTGDIRATYV